MHMQHRPRVFNMKFINCVRAGVLSQVFKLMIEWISSRKRIVRKLLDYSFLAKTAVIVRKSESTYLISNVDQVRLFVQLACQHIYIVVVVNEVK